MDPRLLDPRMYSYEYRRPRPGNPTYLSNNVNSSMTNYLADIPHNNIVYHQQNSPKQHLQYNFEANNQQNVHFEIPKNKSALFDNQKPKALETNDYIKSPNMQSKQVEENRTKTNSNLSNYGSSLLNNRSSIYNQQEVYKKQEKKYNIITCMPREYDQTIKQYPKLTLEDKDAYFSKRVQAEQRVTKLGGYHPVRYEFQ